MRRHVWSAAAAAAMVLIVAQSALAAITNVSIFNFAFDPPSARARLGDAVMWTNNDGLAHTSTSDGYDGCCQNGPRLWASGPISPSGTFTFTFVAAGTYGYHCTIHQRMRGTIGVAVRVSPKTGGVTTTFTVTWAKGGVPAGYNEDIQIKRPGVPGFVDWMIDQQGSSVSAAFVPDAGTGTYRFQARLQANQSPTKASEYSPAFAIIVS